jgi:hypothetical protein
MVFEASDAGEVWIVDGHDIGIVFDGARSRARREGRDIILPRLLCKLESDEGDGAVHRVRRRLGRWRIVGPRFHDNAGLRAALAMIQHEDLRARPKV